MTVDTEALERQIAEWRAFVARGKAIAGPDVEELEGHLRDQIEALTGAGLDADEAFLVAVKRIGSLNALSREFAREHSERLWRQLVLGADGSGGKPLRTRTDRRPGPCRGGRRGDQGPGALRHRLRGRHAGLLRAQPELLRPPVPDRLPGLEAGPGRRGLRAPAHPLRRGRPGGEPLSVSARGPHVRSWRRSISPSPSGWSWAWPTSASAGGTRTNG